MIVTLLTDFGTRDSYVAAMKAALLSVDPGIVAVDISHQVPPQDVETGAYILHSCWSDFPAGSVHLAVVDPGVGSSRRAIACRADGRYLVGPDNGLFDWVLLAAEDREVRSIDHPALFGSRGSHTFHGRDVFAPTAAALASGFSFEEVGEEVSDWVGLPSLNPESNADGLLGRILHVDSFGNCITNFLQEQIRRVVGEKFSLEIGAAEVENLHSHFDEAADSGAFVYWGSAGFLEIAIRGGSAAERLGVQRGDRVVARPSDGRSEVAKDEHC